MGEEIVQKKKSKIFAGIVLSIALLAGIGAVLFYVVLPKFEIHVIERVTMEAGDEFPAVTAFFDKEHKTMAFAESLASYINPKEVGEYEVKLLLREKEYTAILEIVDTTPPEVVTDSATIDYWETVSVEDLILSITDCSQTKAEFEETPDFTIVGTHEIPIVVTDIYENEVIVTAKVEVLPDTEPPVITGVKDITATVGNSISYRKDIEITDNSGGEVSLEIDTSNVDASSPGTYVVHYIATDPSGNVTTVDANITLKPQVLPTEASLTPYLDNIIRKVTNDGMSKYDKAYALWNWCRRNISYSYSGGNRSTIWHGVYEGVYQHRGDCYAYYATYSALLTRCGIDNLCVTRVGGTSNHWWNLVNTGSGWYHCDASPRSNSDPYSCFMQTDAQVAAYTANHTQKPNYYTFDTTLYPERATTIIFGN